MFAGSPPTMNGEFSTLLHVASWKAAEKKKIAKSLSISSEFT